MASLSFGKKPANTNPVPQNANDSRLNSLNFESCSITNDSENPPNEISNSDNDDKTI